MTDSLPDPAQRLDPSRSGLPRVSSPIPGIDDGRRRVQIERVRPAVDDGRFSIKRVVGEPVEVTADVYADGHDVLGGVLRYRPLAADSGGGASAPADPGAAVRRAGEGPAAPRWREVPLRPLGNDLWTASFTPDAIGRWAYDVEAWVDAFGTWRHRFEKKVDARQDLELELRAGAELLRQAARRARNPAIPATPPQATQGVDEPTAGSSSAPAAGGNGGGGAADPAQDAATLEELATRLLATANPVDERARLALSPSVEAIAHRWPDRTHAARRGTPLEVVVDPVIGRTSAWYELFPRSFASVPGRHGTFRDAEAVLPYVAKMGFDILYLPPIHPIGRSFRKGRNNALVAEPLDPGSPWAIGAAEGGHKSIHPELGTLADFERFVGKARDHGLSVALDVAFQASPDHPWVKDHPAWFRHRPDGSIQYAENPPKKYQDIYPIDFESEDWPGLWRELRSVFAFWAERGVRIFRVDNPHTKSLAFWEWCIRSLKDDHPDLVFLSEAFTRPRLMYGLAKRGFTQSYTYFTWRFTAGELRSYVEELAHTEVVDFFRPSFWPNTPDILPPYLQEGRRATFVQRAVLASTLSPSWGIYGPAFELMEHQPRPGVEEYVDNEKYEIRRWDLERSDSLAPLIGRLNQIRKKHPALQELRNIVFHETDNPTLLCYSKRAPDGRDVVLVIVSMDDVWPHSGWTDLDTAALGLGSDQEFEVHDLLADTRYRWRGPRNYVELHPEAIPAHVFHVNPESRSHGA